jgi:1-phosphofructokinase
MIVTITPNTTVDLTVFIREWGWGKTIRAAGTVQSMGGKPTDASWILGELGIASHALGFAAGAMGAKVEAMLSARGVHADFVPVEGDTRTNVVIVLEDGDGQRIDQTTITTSSLRVAPDHIDALRAKVADALDTASCVVLGGTVPTGLTADFYAECIALCRARGIVTVYDAAEPNLSIGLRARPTYIKPNEHELAALVGRPIATLHDAYTAGRAIVDAYGTQPIITLGERGLLAVLADRAVFVEPLHVPVVSTSGAGDAVLAGLAASIERGEPIERGLALGTAAAAAVVMMPGTADCRRADVERLLPQVRMREYTAT